MVLGKAYVYRAAASLLEDALVYAYVYALCNPSGFYNR